ncbi:MAG: hypothetical protein JSR59_16115 [Proteobacteria bacterium]|nr:hypothetical protein [Pseudomonadota bacterium]
MNWRAALRNASIALVSAWVGWAYAEPISVARLEHLLQAQPPGRTLHFDEVHESPWLTAPATSSGSMRSTATMLEKQVDQPRRETWRILDDRLEWTAPGSAETKQLLFSQAPAAGELGKALRHVLAGDLAALGDDFRLLPGGDEHLWTLRLTPRRTDVARVLQELELQGSGPDVQVIMVRETRGDRTTTRLTHQP